MACSLQALLLNTPLEQFLVVPLWCLHLFGNTSLFFVSNYSLMLSLVALSGLVGFVLATGPRFRVFSYFPLFIETYYTFVVTIIRENFVKKGFYFLPYLFLLLSFLLLANMLGMIPYSFALTSHFAVTLYLSFLSFFSGVFLGFQKHGLNMFSLFLPNGAPFVLAPFLILVETISFFARLFSLAIRLFANIMSGHTLLKILAGFGWVLLCELFSLLGLVPFIVVFVITGLELVIAFLQGYVFTVLSSIYLNEALQLH